MTRELQAGEIGQIREEIYRFFENQFPAANRPEYQAIRYSLLHRAGKLSRPLMVIQTARAYGSKKDLLPHATAIECVHRGSLMLDDLPSMDNSKLRHGELSCWNHFYREFRKTYGGEEGAEARARKDAVALTEMAAVRLMSPVPIELVQMSDADPEQKDKIISRLTQVSDELCRGQTVDLGIGRRKEERRTSCEELKMYRMKTGSLYATSAVIGGILGGASEEDLKHLRIFGNVFGIAYQLIDDWHDRYGDSREMGKPIKQDEMNGRPSLAYKLTAKKLKKEVGRYRARALKELRECSTDLGELESIVKHVAQIPDRAFIKPTCE